MFTLWYIYLGIEEFRRRGYFRWPLWWKSQDRAGLAPADTDTTSTTVAGPKTDGGPSPPPARLDTSAGHSSSTGLLDKSKEAITSRSNEKSVEPATPKPIMFDSPEISDKNLKSADTISILHDNATVTDKLISSEKASSKNEDLIRDSKHNVGERKGDDRPLFKDSKSLIASESSETPVKKQPIVEKPNISFTDKPFAKLTSSDSPTYSESVEGGPPTDMTVRTPPARDQKFLESLNKPKRSQITENDDRMEISSQNKDLLSNRKTDSAESILKDSDDFLRNERRVTGHTSKPKEVSITQHQPTLFAEDIPPLDKPETKDTSPSAVRLKREAEQPAVAALKEDWRRKRDSSLKKDAASDDDDDETIVFGDSDDPDGISQLVEFSDDEN